LFLTQFGFKIVRVTGWGQSDMLVKLKKRWQSSRAPLAQGSAAVLHDLSRKRNKFFRHLEKYYGMRTPLRFAHCWNFDCQLDDPGADPIAAVAAGTLH
jgi:hypothetical protein